MPIEFVDMCADGQAELDGGVDSWRTEGREQLRMAIEVMMAIELRQADPDVLADHLQVLMDEKGALPIGLLYGLASLCLILLEQAKDDGHGELIRQLRELVLALDDGPFST